MRGEVQGFQQGAQLSDGERLLEEIALAVAGLLSDKELLRIAAGGSGRAMIDDCGHSGAIIPH